MEIHNYLQSQNGRDLSSEYEQHEFRKETFLECENIYGEYICEEDGKGLRIYHAKNNKIEIYVPYKKCATKRCYKYVQENAKHCFEHATDEDIEIFSYEQNGEIIHSKIYIPDNMVKTDELRYKYIEQLEIELNEGE